MKILIVYGSTEGQTAKIAEYAAARFRREGYEASCFSAEAPGLPAPGDADAVVVAGSVHAGRYQKALVDYVAAHAPALGARKTLFLSVSLAAAGEVEEDWAGLADCVRGFARATGWEPQQVEHVAGALRYSEYDFFRYWAMRWIAARRDEDATPGEDKEYTDWARLDAVLDSWVADT